MTTAPISASLVKTLRDRTAAGMMECKAALEATHGDLDEAVVLLRKQGKLKAEKRAGKVAAEGIVVVAQSSDQESAVMMELNCETDFVAGGDDFKKFAEDVVQVALKNQVQDPAILGQQVLPATGNTIDHTREELIGRIGENIQIRRLVAMQAPGGMVGAYRHGSRIAVLVAIDQKNENLVKDLAMHIAASRPQAIGPEDVDAGFIEKEKEIFMAQAQQSGKPADIVERIVAGQIKKMLQEVSLVEQPFVRDANSTIKQLLQTHKAQVLQFARIEVGEGIEKKSEDFAKEVMEQIKNTQK